MKKTTNLLFVAIICVILLLSSCRVKHNEQEKELFRNYKDDFELINDYMLGNCDVKSDESVKNILLTRQAEEITDIYYGENMKISPSLKSALNRIDNCISPYNFSFITMTDERVSYAGEGYRMYVFSRNGKTPNYYYHEDDGMNPDVYKLDGDWYLLTVNYR